MGGDGADVLTGGGQGDTLFGGKGADHFVFSALSDSMGAEFDTIQDFEKGSDLITLIAIDAVLGGVDDVFRFIGTQAFSNTGPEVRYQLNTANGTTLIQVHMAGSANADSQIVLNGLYDLTADSFVL
jgi:serralysin